MQNLKAYINNVRASEMSLDTETTGLYPYKNSDLFSIIIGNINESVYLDFNEGGLPKSSIIELNEFTQDKNITWYMQNAKFDMHFLAKHGVFFNQNVIDLRFLSKINYNQHMSYSLADIAKRHGFNKSTAVDDYLKSNGLSYKNVCDKTGREYVSKGFEKVPFEIISEYGKQDALATINSAKKLEALIPEKDIINTEKQLLSAVFSMEHLGVKIDVEYCKKAIANLSEKMNEIEQDIFKRTGLIFSKGTKFFEQVFLSEKDKWEMTDKGNYKWDKDTISKFENPVAFLVADWSEAKKNHEYFENFLFFSDKDGVIHTNFDQSGTATGRFSSNSPNCQNLTSKDKYTSELDAEKYTPRAAFIPRKGYFFAMIDYSQVEFRMLLEYCNAKDLINKINNENLDVHTATSELAGVSRKDAKSANFLCIYGGGASRLASSLYPVLCNVNQLKALNKHINELPLDLEEEKTLKTISREKRKHDGEYLKKAKNVQDSIFRASPEIKQFIKRVQSAASTRGYIKTWSGRSLYFPKKELSYAAVNHLIQGGAAEVIKIAMIKCHEYLADKKSKLLLTIHDELVFEVKIGEEFVVKELINIMQNAFPSKLIPLIVDCEYSYKNLAEKSPWDNNLGNANRDTI